MTARSGGAGAGQVFVVDTSSIIQVRQLMSQEKRERVTTVYARLIGLAQRGVLHFPKGVIEEIRVGPTKFASGTDPACSWADACDGYAVANHEVMREAGEVLAEVPDLLDVSKPSTTDEADPYVVGLALKLLRDGEIVTVITEEKNDSPGKTSMNSACGIMRIPSISIRVFLARNGIWP
jgi:uncharacterized protein DUF4411